MRNSRDESTDRFMDDEFGGDDFDIPIDDGGGYYEKYESKEVLGKGMSSTVRRCVEKSSGKSFAVKIIDVTTEKVSEEEADLLKSETMREIQLLRQLTGHPQIIELHDYYESSTFIFIIFELAIGGELFDYLTRVVTLSEKKTRHIMRQLLVAVDAMHSQSIVHRDLKPENILMVNDEDIKLTDFGFAIQISPKEKLKELVGTPGYLAPEVLQVQMFENAKGYGIEVDLWACGVIMYTLLCGYAPFFHRKQIYMLRAIQQGKYEFRSPEWDEISDTAKDLIRNLLVIDPKKRYSTKDALKHPFIAHVPLIEESQLPSTKKFNARRRFKIAILQIRSLVRILRIKIVPLLIPVTSAKADPYSTRKVRRQIDAVAFRVYGHWVKKGREQYRDALFANTPKFDSVRRRKPKAKSMPAK